MAAGDDGRISTMMHDTDPLTRLYRARLAGEVINPVGDIARIIALEDAGWTLEDDGDGVVIIPPPDGMSDTEITRMIDWAVCDWAVRADDEAA